MAMYYQSSSSEIQGGDGVHTLYLMNPNYVGGGGGGYSSVSDNQPNMLFFNPPAAAAAMPQPHHFVDPTPRHHLYTTWGTATLVDDDMPQQTPRGLSLSLSAHHKTAGDRDHFPAGQIISPSKNCSSLPSLTTTESINGVNSMQSAVIMGSKYLKAAQELLDEVVNVGNSETKTLRPDKPPPPPKIIKEDKSAAAAELSLTAAQRQEIQMKKAKLNSMLDEVEQRCRQYNQQMQVIVASFEQAAGIGTAKSYTQLALKTILKQFRCLKSTISAQIKGLNKSLGEEEGSDNKSEGPTRLRFVDHQLRQQRALQQLGMMQNSAWRPQRGLPERAVSVLRAWLFEHFLHPYPKDSDKQMLAKQTGLTRSQVSNWFINARVRLWKPMVEEMYIEETKNNQNQIPNDGGAASIKPEPDNKTPRPTAPPPPEISAAAALPARTNFAQLISSLNMENLAPEKSPKKPRNASSLSADDRDHDQATSIKRFSSTEINYLSMPAAAAAAANDHVSRYVGADQQLAAGGFGLQGNGFSLSLALPPTDHHQSQHNFLSHRNFELVDGGGIGGGEGGAAAAASHPSIAYEILDFQSRKPFPAQLLPDFVA